MLEVLSLVSIDKSTYQRRLAEVGINRVIIYRDYFDHG